MNDTDWTGLVAAAAGIIGLFGLLSILVWQIGSTLRTRAMVSKDRAHVRLAEDVAAAQQQVAVEMAELRERLTAIEKLLRDVG